MIFRRIFAFPAYRLLRVAPASCELMELSLCPVTRYPDLATLSRSMFPQSDSVHNSSSPQANLPFASSLLVNTYSSYRLARCLLVCQGAVPPLISMLISLQFQ